MIELRAPFPYFGGKRRVADEVWRRLGDVKVYREPFCGSCAVLLARPSWTGRRDEVVNDASGNITNLWRAIKHRPDEVAAEARRPTHEIDYHAAHRLCYHDTEGLVERLRADIDYCEPRRAALFIFGLSAQIGGAFIRGHSLGGMPAISAASRRGTLAPQLDQDQVQALMRRLAHRLTHVDVMCGDWSRVLSRSALIGRGHEPAGVFLDPPYDSGSVSYGQTDEQSISVEVRKWCIQYTHFDFIRIAICGYDHDHDELLEHGWTVHSWSTHGGFGKARANDRERVWFSPACIDTPTQHTLF